MNVSINAKAVLSNFKPQFLTWNEFSDILVTEIQTNKKLQDKIKLAGDNAELYFKQKQEVKKLTKYTHAGYIISNVLKSLIRQAKQDWILYGEFQFKKYKDFLAASEKLINISKLTPKEKAVLDMLNKDDNYIKEFILLQSKRLRFDQIKKLN
jgi:hypothetical protein